MKFKTLFFFLFVFIFCLLGNTFALKITGKAVGYEGKFVRLYRVADYISGTEIKLDVFQIDAQGGFVLNGNMHQSGMVKLKIDDIKIDLIVKPEFKLSVELTYDQTENEGHFFDKQFKLKILENSDDGLNQLIFEYQKAYADFLEKNHSNLVTKKILPHVYVFQEDMRNKFSKADPYFKLYLEYDLAALEDAVLGSEEKLYKEHLRNRPVYFDNLAYMNFFKQFYQERFIQLSQGKEGFQMLSAVNGTQDYDKLLEIVRNHPFVDNDTMAQLFMVLGLKEVYGDETFKKPKVLSMLVQLEKSAINSDIKGIAKNVITELTFLKNGQPAPDFNLKDQYGKLHHLTDFNGKPVFIIFWSAYSNTSLRDFTWLKDYYVKYGGQIYFIAINMDDELSKAINYLDKNEMPFISLFKDRQFDLVDKYRIYSTPEYLLIDKKGKIDKYRAGRPEQNLEAELHRLASEN